MRCHKISSVSVIIRGALTPVVRPKSSGPEAKFRDKTHCTFRRVLCSSVPGHLRASSNSHKLVVKGRLALPQGSPIQPNRRHRAGSLTNSYEFLVTCMSRNATKSSGPATRQSPLPVLPLHTIYGSTLPHYLWQHPCGMIQDAVPKIDDKIHQIQIFSDSGQTSCSSWLTLVCHLIDRFSNNKLNLVWELGEWNWKFIAGEYQELADTAQH